MFLVFAAFFISISMLMYFSVAFVVFCLCVFVFASFMCLRCVQPIAALLHLSATVIFALLPSSGDHAMSQLPVLSQLEAMQKTKQIFTTGGGNNMLQYFCPPNVFLFFF